jgi:hypothetical protein
MIRLQWSGDGREAALYPSFTALFGARGLRSPGYATHAADGGPGAYSLAHRLVTAQPEANSIAHPLSVSAPMGSGAATSHDPRCRL